MIVGCSAHVETGTSKDVLVCLLRGSTKVDMWEVLKKKGSQMKLNVVTLGLSLEAPHSLLHSPLTVDLNEWQRLGWYNTNHGSQSSSLETYHAYVRGVL